MAHTGLDSQFGLRGTSLAHVSGWGGWPLGVVVGVDGRPTIVCRTLAQTPQDHRRNRFDNPPVSTTRIVSVPPNGRPFGPETVFGPDADGLVPLRTIARENRIAALAAVTRANRQIPTLRVFSADVLAAGDPATWSLVDNFELTDPEDIAARNCGLGWADVDGTVMVVAPRQNRLNGGFQLTLFKCDGSEPRDVVIPYPSTLNEPAGYGIQMAVGAVLADPHDGFLIGLTWQLVRRGRPFLPIGVFEQERASVLRLRRQENSLRGAYEVDPEFASNGMWIANESAGMITTADLGAIVATVARRPTGAHGFMVAGRAERAGVKSLFAVLLDAVTGAETDRSYPAIGVFERPTGIAVDHDNRVLVCASSAALNLNSASDISEAVVVRLGPGCTADPSFGQHGITRFRLHGGTHPSAITASYSGEAFVASAVGWGWEASASTFHACISKLTATGELDPQFGLTGIARHDGIGEAHLAASGPGGEVWSAGRADFSLGRLLTFSKLTTSGELASSFGTRGIATLRLSDLLPTDERNFELGSLVPLADGRAIAAGYYYAEINVGTAVDPDFRVAPRGTWILRLTANGGLDPTFGAGGVLMLPSRLNIEILSELADGSLQGFEGSPGARALLRLAPDGGPAAGWGATGNKPLPPTSGLVPFRNFHPSGEWFALTLGPLAGTSATIGLVRGRPDGSIDPGFGAGSPNPPATCFVDIAGTGKYGARPDRNWPAKTLRLSDGTYLTIWSLQWQVSVNGPGFPHPIPAHPLGVLLLAWDENGIPKAIHGPSWNGSAVRAIANPNAPLVWWLGWRPRCALLQPDGSILVGLQGDEVESVPTINQPPKDGELRQTFYFCRLIPPTFDLDSGFGNKYGVVYGRVPGEEDQFPVSIHAANQQRVVAAVLLQQLDVGFARRAPELPFDGSIGVVALA